MNCKVNDCESPVRANGFCGKHNAHNKRHGSPTVKRHLSTADSFNKPTRPQMHWVKRDPATASQSHHTSMTVSKRQLKRMQAGESAAGKPTDYQRTMKVDDAQRIREARWRIEDINLAKDDDY